MDGSEELLRRIERRSVAVCGLLAVTAGVVTGGVEAALGVAGGGGLAAISYRGIKAGITAAGRPERERRAVLIGLVKFFTRYAILAGAAYVIMARLRLPIVAVFAGASSLVIAVMVEAVRGVIHPRQSATGGGPPE